MNIDKLLSLFPVTRKTGRHYQDFDTADEAKSFAERFRSTYPDLEVFQSGVRVYLGAAMAEQASGR